MSQKDLATESGVDIGILAAIELGYGDPTYVAVRRLAVALGVPASGLLALADEVRMC